MVEELADAPGFRDADGGTPYLTYRDDRFRCVTGEDRLKDCKITPRTPTRRVLASCCNTAMFLKFEPGHWVSAYRARFEGEVPPIQMKTQTKFRRAATLPDDVPTFRGFPLRLFGKLIAARAAMWLGR